MKRFAKGFFKSGLVVLVTMVFMQGSLVWGVVAKDDPRAQNQRTQKNNLETKPVHQKGRYFKSVNKIRKYCASIMDTEQDRTMITTGDTIFLTNSPTKNMQKNAKYMIYKYTKKKLPKAGQRFLEWYEEVGQVKILENHGKISIGRVVAARDIIHQGDVVYLGTNK